MPVGIPLSGLKSRFTFLWKKRIKEKSKTPHWRSPYACAAPQNQPLSTEMPGVGRCMAMNTPGFSSLHDQAAYTGSLCAIFNGLQFSEETESALSGKCP